MSLIKELSTKYKVLSIVGMAKNAGKTTALNYFIEEAMDEMLALGVVSTGRDGESTDIVTGTEKPRVYLYEGTLVSTTTDLYDFSEAGLEILRITDFSTPLGMVMICRVRSSGYVQISGPVTASGHRSLCREMTALGAEMILIDGSVDRRSIAAPESSDAIILSTGAVLSRSMKKIAEETAHIAGLYRLPVVRDGEVASLIRESVITDRIMLIEGGRLKPLELLTGLASSRFLDEAITDKTDYVFIPGALTGSVIADIYPPKIKNVKFVLKDPTRIFISSSEWRQYIKKGFDVSVLSNIKIAAITVNPVAPLGYSFEHEELQRAVQAAVPDIPVIDVRL